MRLVFKSINIFLAIGVFLIALGIAYVAIPYFGNQALIVRSGSMEPTIGVGSVVVVRPEIGLVSPQSNTAPIYNKDDIIAFRSENDPNTLITHRVVGSEIKENGIFYQTKGDANEEVDSWMVREKDIVGKTFFTLPLAGYLLAFAKSNTGFPLLIIIPAVLVMILELFNVIKELKGVKKTKAITEIRHHLHHPAKHGGKFHLSGLKVLVPLLAVGLIIPVAFAFPGDTETSTGNVFSAARDFGTVLSPTPTPTLPPDVTPTPTGINPGDVVINEIMWMGSQGNSADEWVELRNMTSSAIDLSNWTVVNLGTGIRGTITIPSGKSIGPNGFFVISNDSNDPQSTSMMSVSPDHFDSGVSLLNPGEQLILKHSNTTTVDTANINDDWFAGEDPPGQNPKKSMERNSTPGDGTVSGSWHTATTQANLDPTRRESATPKPANNL